MNMEFKIRNYTYAAGVYAVCLETKRILLCKRGPKLENEPNKWANLGGGSETGEAPAETAVREFYEESGRYIPVKLIPSFVDKNKGGFRFYNFIGIVENEFVPLVGQITVDFEVEITDYRWLTLKQLMNMKKSEIHFGVDNFRKEAEEQLKSLIG